MAHPLRFSSAFKYRRVRPPRGPFVSFFTTTLFENIHSFIILQFFLIEATFIQASIFGVCHSAKFLGARQHGVVESIESGSSSCRDSCHFGKGSRFLLRGLFRSVSSFSELPVPRVLHDCFSRAIPLEPGQHVSRGRSLKDVHSLGDRQCQQYRHSSFLYGRVPSPWLQVRGALEPGVSMRRYTFIYTERWFDNHARACGKRGGLHRHE